MAVCIGMCESSNGSVSCRMPMHTAIPWPTFASLVSLTQMPVHTGISWLALAPFSAKKSNAATAFGSLESLV